jgi:hypothetical protein
MIFKNLLLIVFIFPMNCLKEILDDLIEIIIITTIYFIKYLYV